MTLKKFQFLVMALAAAVTLAWAPGAAAKKSASIMINFQPGTLTMINEKDIMKAAMFAVEKGYTLQIEGFSCMADGEVSEDPTFRLQQAGKRADIVLSRILKYGVPNDNVYSISYEKGQCAAVITVMK